MIECTCACPEIAAAQVSLVVTAVIATVAAVVGLQLGRLWRGSG